MKYNIITEKSFVFARRIIRVYKELVETIKEFVLSKQLLRSGNSIGANVEEAIGSQSSKDFLSKISIAYKEARETKYWIELLSAEEFVIASTTESLLNDIEALFRILGSIQIAQKAKIKSFNS